MCMNCGCDLPNDDHGNPANITYTDVLKAMVAGGVSNITQTLQNMCDTYSKMLGTGKSDLRDDYDGDDDKGIASASMPTADKGDGPGTVPNDPNYLRNSTQYVKQPN